MLVFIDAGHGGVDRGEIGRGGLVEKDLSLSISLKEKKIFEKLGHEVVMARMVDEYIPLTRRVETANNMKADVYISNHVNSGGARGVEVWHSVSDERGKELAEKICEYISRVGLINRGVKTKKGISGDYHLVIRETSMTSVIIEYGFIDSAYDGEFFRDEYFIERMAEAVVRAVLEVFIDNESTEFLKEDDKEYGVLLEGVCMMTVNSLESAKRYIMNAERSKLCGYAEIIDNETGESVFDFHI